MTDLATAPPPPPPAADPPANPAAEATANPTTTGGGIKETVESILVAFILAFVFRAFVVEAFVIPTGSMATTLLGAHTRFTCPDCGYAFDVNFSAPNANEDEDVSVPATAGVIQSKIYCPNCGYQMPDAQINDPPVAYGDRILVLKYLYLLSEPRPWDVVVFKSPTNPNQNFIKRLVGKPGEAVLILDGHAYIRAPGDPDPAHFVIRPKPPGVQDAMWRVVYDNDLHPAGRTRDNGVPWAQPWRVGYGRCDQASAAGGREFRFDALGAGAKLEYDPHANPTTQGFNDYLAYNQTAVPERRPEPDWVGLNDFPVTDLDLRLTYQRTAGTGPFTAALTKRDDTFTAELTPTTATLYHDVGGKRTVVGHPFSLPAGAAPVRVELSDASYHALLWVNGTVVAQTTTAEYAPDARALYLECQSDVPAPYPKVSIRADDQQASVRHLSLWRDVYYYNRNPPNQQQLKWAVPANAPAAFPAGAQVLGPDEYFTMGDNSQLSYDARCWPDGVRLPAEDLDVGPGRVPGRFLLGKAFYVYWPAGYKAAGWLPSFVPNFGGMRIIH